MGQPAWSGMSMPRHRLRAVASTFALAAFMLLAGCGDSDDPSQAGTSAATTPAEKVSWTLVLDYEPNAVHAGLLRAEAAGYFDRAGINLKIVAPSSTSDALTQVGRGRADVGLADLIDVARRNERALAETSKGTADVDTPMVSLAAAIVQRPLSGLIVDADGPVKTPADLQGKRIAVSGLPSDVAVIDAMVRKDGAPLPTENITLGFNGLKALDAGRVDASTAYWPADSVTLEQLGTKARTFALDRFGGPRYPGLVAFTSRRLRVEDPAHVAAFAEALAHGTRDVLETPADGLAAIAEDYPELDAGTTDKQLRNYLPLFGTAEQAAGLDQTALGDFTTFASEAGLTDERLTVPELAGLPPESGAK